MMLIWLISGVLALVLVVGLNVRHALNDYGVKDGNLHAEVMAQSTGTGGGTGTGTGGGENGSETGNNPIETFQKSKVKITITEKKTNDPGYSWDVGLNVWIFQGKATSKSPSSSWEEKREVELDCCDPKGDLLSCNYRRCIN